MCSWDSIQYTKPENRLSTARKAIFWPDGSKGPGAESKRAVACYHLSGRSFVRHYTFVLLALSVCALRAQNSAGETSAPTAPVEDKRAYGVLPNYRTAELS